MEQFWAERSRTKGLKERLTSFWSEIVAEAVMEEGNCELEFGFDNYKKLNKSFHLSRILN